MSQPNSIPPHLLPPFVSIEGVMNCRSLPLPNTTNKPVFLYRAGNISRITSAGIDTLQYSLNVKTIYDFRSPGDVVQYESPTPIIPGIQIINVPLYQEELSQKQSEAAWMQTQTMQGEGSRTQYEDPTLERYLKMFRADELAAFMNVYDRILLEGKAGIALVLRKIIESKGDEGILFHCSGGKDRTGVMAAIILSLACVDEEIIANDYALTGVGMEPYKDFFLQRFENMKAFRENREGAMNMFSSRPETMLAFLSRLKETHGGAHGYVRDILGFTDEEVAKLQKVLIH